MHRHLLALLAAFLVFGLGALAGAADDGTPPPPADPSAGGEKKDEGKKNPSDPPAQPPAAETPKPVFPRLVSHRAYSDALRAYCAEKKIDLKEQGDGPVKLLLIGGMQVAKPGDILRLAKQTLDGYEMWSGQQEIFTRKQPLPDEIYHLVVFKNDADYTGLVDFLRARKLMKPPEGAEDLAKKVAGFPGPRMMFTKGELALAYPENWAIYSTSCMAIDAFYASHSDKRAPAWIREGMAAEMQRVQCKGVIKCTTIAYEDNKEAPVDNWTREIANMLARRDPKLISATDAMRLGLNALAGAHYRQMWSLCSFIRSNCGTKKGPENKFLRLLLATAEGTESESAVKTVLGVSDPSLTDAWRQWARELK